MSDHTALIDRYEQGAQLFAEAMGGVPPVDLDRAPAPGKWTIRQIAIHTIDAELVFSTRIRMLAGQDGAKIIAFNQDNWAAAMAYDRQPIGERVTLFKALRAVNAPCSAPCPRVPGRASGTTRSGVRRRSRTWSRSTYGMERSTLARSAM